MQSAEELIRSGVAFLSKTYACLALRALQAGFLQRSHLLSRRLWTSPGCLPCPLELQRLHLCAGCTREVDIDMVHALGATAHALLQGAKHLWLPCHMLHACRSKCVGPCLCWEAIHDQHHFPRSAPAMAHTVGQAQGTLGRCLGPVLRIGWQCTFAVFQAPEHISPLCCLMRLVGLTVNLGTQQCRSAYLELPSSAMLTAGYSSNVHSGT